MTGKIDWRHFKALTFDCYGTLIDWERGLLAAVRPWATEHGITVDDEALLAMFAGIESPIQSAQPKLLYPDVLRAALRALASRLGVSVTKGEQDSVGNSIRDWPVFPDSAAALAYLARHYKLVIVSNVDNASFAHSNRKLGVEFASIVTAEDVGSYKPDPAHFHEAFRRLLAMGIERSEILHVAQSLFHDHVPAKALGMTTVWINRRAGKAGQGATPVSAAVTPDAEYSSMAAFAEAHLRETAGVSPSSP